jgi:hypothetical protein
MIQEIFAIIQTRKLYHFCRAFRNAPVKEMQAVHHPSNSIVEQEKFTTPLFVEVNPNKS